MNDECRRFDEALVDLCYDELAHRESEALREHASRCPRCRNELESLLLLRRLAQRLPELAPPPSVDQAVLDAARQRAVELAQRPASPPLSIGSGPSLAERLRRLFLRPALALSASTALAALVAYVVLNSEPAQPLDGGAPAQVAKGGPATLPAVPPSGSLATQKSKELASDQGLTRKKEGRENEFLPGAPARLGTSAGLPESVASRARPSAAPEPSSSRAQEKTSASSELDDFQGNPARAAQPRSESTSSSDALSRALAAYKRGDCPSARPDLESIASDTHASQTTVATALHTLARCEKRSGSCGKAISLYRQLLRNHPRYAGRSEALFEAAACLRKLGQDTEADRLLEELDAAPEPRRQETVSP